MKKTLVVMALAAVMAASSFAAAAKVAKSASKVGFGVKGTIGMTNVSITDATGFGMKIGFGGGLLAQIKAGKTMVIQPELLFVMGGSKIDTGDSGISAGIKTSSIELPILLKGVFGEGKTKPCVFIGPSLSMLMSAKEYVEDASGSIKDSLNTLGFGLVGGVGVQMEKLMFDVRYDMGLSNMAKDAPDGMSMKQYAILLSVGYMFQ
jgi:hypothetical protein